MNNKVEANDTSPLRVAQYICSAGFYGAEKWTVALAANSVRDEVLHELLLTPDSDQTESQLSAEFVGLGLAVTEIPMKSRFDFGVVNDIVSYIQQNDIDIIHTHGYKSDIIGVLAARKSGIKCVCTPHGFDSTSDIKLRLFNFIGRQSFRFFNKVVPLSQDLHDTVKRYGIKKQNLVLINNGVNLLEIDDALRTNVTRSGDQSNSSSAFTIGFIGRLVSGKNLKDLIMVFAQLQINNPAIRLLLVGDGELREELEDLAASACVEATVEFTGFVSNTADYYTKLDLFVMTSVSEGIPRSIMEAMAFGVPVVAYDIPGVNSLIENEKTGTLVPLGDTEALYNAVQFVVNNTSSTTESTKRAREYLENNYSAVRMAREYSSLYFDMM